MKRGGAIATGCVTLLCKSRSVAGRIGALRITRPYNDYFAQVSLSVIVRLKTGWPGLESLGSRAK